MARANTVNLRQAAQMNDGTAVLGPITVEAQRGAAATATIGTTPPPFAGGQVATGGRIGLLGNRDSMNTPFSTQSYTRELIQNQQARSTADVLLYNPSVRLNSPANSTFEEFFVRGFEVRSDDSAFDGLYGLVSPRRTATETLERVELLKGPSALLNGIPPNAAVGGAINLVAKRAGKGSWSTARTRPAGSSAPTTTPS